MCIRDRLVASGVISLLAWALGLISLMGVVWCIIAAFVATNLESLIGATLQSQWDWLTNELVNVINTLIGALVAISLGWLWLNAGGA